MNIRKFNTIQKSCGWLQTYRILSEKYGLDQTEKLFENASESYDKYKERFKQVRGIQKEHTLAAVAVSSLYMELVKLMNKEDAVELLSEAMKPASISKHNKIERLPAPVFMKVAGFITGKIFSEEAGFKRKWHCNNNHEKRYDLLTCPYVNVFSELGCPEVCPAVCVQDDISFGNMKNGVCFERKGTLGRGNECCDFCFRIT
ncbi:L-2-amino-thiazoline-4-carboxylic acid hydrolase [Butyrivibrio sp. WCD2001]|uniref:L-2-amino-thiazoline-4-carboxylic acid hydrolase n=1 Tax=Butyrivibrio sp. WCD2001 TaxID=1280681 RepID=UPI0004193057|nr:L-2-amino-thiazoline-4-carboxylic acid hydrolase [Butyrivibrio sp. WCD2001]